MTKVDLIDQVSQKTELPKRDVERMLEAAIAAMQQALTHGEKVSLTGLGVFTVADRKARVARNPKTGARVDVPAKRVPFFKPAKELRDLVNADAPKPQHHPVPPPPVHVDAHHPPPM